MSSAAFDISEDYANEWRFRDGVKDATHRRLYDDGALDSPTYPCKAQRQEISKSDWVTFANAILASSDTTLWQVWPTNEAQPDPAIDDSLVIDGETWKLRGVTQPLAGRTWIVAATKTHD